MLPIPSAVSTGHQTQSTPAAADPLRGAQAQLLRVGASQLSLWKELDVLFWVAPSILCPHPCMVHTAFFTLQL